MRILIVLFIALCSFTACKKVETPSYSGIEGIAFYLSSGPIDSLNYSFANQGSSVTRDTVFVNMRISGSATNYERLVEIEAANGTTAEEGKHYLLPAVKLPANAFTVETPVILIKTAELKQKTFRLVLKVKENQYFKQGTVGRTNNADRNITNFKINLNDQLIKPEYWLYLTPYFGDYSVAKHQFIINVLKISDLKPDLQGGPISYSDFLNYNGTLKNAKRVYEAQYGLLVDETGKEITFPL